MSARNNHRPVIFTDDGWVLSATEPPVTVEDLKNNVIGAYAQTGGALWWATGDHELYHFETKIGEIFGDDIDGLDQSTYSFVHSSTPGVIDKINRNVHSLINESGGPMTSLINLCKKAGLEFFPRVRMNSHYVIDTTNPAYGRFRRDHPELLIGKPDEKYGKGSQAWGLRTGKNYAFPEVRNYMKNIIFETFERFDVDGVELDFMRHPGWFRIEEAYQNRYLMTDLIREVKTRLKEVGDDRNKSLDLAVRVPPTIHDSVRTGLDVQEWISEGLVDIVIVGGGFIPFDTPVKEFVKVAEDTDCLIYGCIEATRSADEDLIIALSNRWLNEGASGIYLYNFYTMSADWNKNIFDKISDVSSLKKLSKRYELGTTGGFYPGEGHGCGFRYASPPAQLPVTITSHPSNPYTPLYIEVNDNLIEATSDNTLDICTLSLRFDKLSREDKFDVKVNDQNIPWSSAKLSLQGWERMQLTGLFWMEYPSTIEPKPQEGSSVEFDLFCPPLKEGQNKIEVRLCGSENNEIHQVTLKGVEISISYK